MPGTELNFDGFLRRTELLAESGRPRVTRPAREEEEAYLRGAEHGYATAIAWSREMVAALRDLAILTGARDVAIFTDRIFHAADELRKIPLDERLAFRDSKPMSE